MKTVSRDVLIEKILKRRPELSREELEEKAESRKEDLPSISDYTAMLLVAVDLGVKLSIDAPSSTKIEKLVDGLNNVTVVGRVLWVREPKVFERKDGTQGSYLRAGICDDTGVCDVVFWDAQKKHLREAGFVEGQVVELAQVQTRRSMTSQVEIHVGSRGRIELKEDNDFPQLTDVLTPLSEVTLEDGRTHIQCRVIDGPRVTEFTREDGEEGVVARYTITDGGRTTSLVLWDDVVEEYEWLQPPQTVAVINSKPKEGLGNDLETHVTKISHIIPLEGEEAESIGYELTDLNSIREGFNMARLVLVVAAVGFRRESEKTDQPTVTAYCVDSAGDASVTFMGDPVDSITPLGPGDVISISGFRAKKRGEDVYVFCDDGTELEIDPEVPGRVELPEPKTDLMSLDDVSMFHKVINVQGKVVKGITEEEAVQEGFKKRGEFLIEADEKPAKVTYRGEITSYGDIEPEEGMELRINGAYVNAPELLSERHVVPLRLRAYSTLEEASST